MSDAGGSEDHSPRLLRWRLGRSGQGFLDALTVGILLLRVFNVGILLLNVGILLFNVGIFQIK